MRTGNLTGEVWTLFAQKHQLDIASLTFFCCYQHTPLTAMVINHVDLSEMTSLSAVFLLAMCLYHWIILIKLYQFRNGEQEVLIFLSYVITLHLKIASSAGWIQTPGCYRAWIFCLERYSSLANRQYSILTAIFFAHCSWRSDLIYHLNMKTDSKSICPFIWLC